MTDIVQRAVECMREAADIERLRGAEEARLLKMADELERAAREPASLWACFRHNRAGFHAGWHCVEQVASGEIYRDCGEARPLFTAPAAEPVESRSVLRRQAAQSGSCPICGRAD